MKAYIGAVFVFGWVGFVYYLAQPIKKTDWSRVQFGTSKTQSDIWVGADLTCNTRNCKPGFHSDLVSDEVLEQINKIQDLCPKCTITVLP